MVMVINFIFYQGQCTVPRTIIFENPHDGSASHSNAQNVLSALKETCKTLGTEASSKSAGTFAQLVRVRINQLII